MNIETLEGVDPTPAQTNLDYRHIAEKYNKLEPGQSLKLDQVYNITSFKAALERRGLRHVFDFRAFHRGKHCYIKRISEAEMIVR